MEKEAEKNNASGIIKLKYKLP